MYSAAQWKLAKMGIKDRDCCCGCGWFSVVFHTIGVYLSWEFLKCHPESSVTLAAVIAALVSIAVNVVFLIFFNYVEVSSSIATKVTVTLGRYLFGLFSIIEVVLLVSGLCLTAGNF